MLRTRSRRGGGGRGSKKGSGRNGGNYTTGLTGGNNQIATRLLEWS